MLITCIVTHAVLIGVGVYKYDAKQLAAAAGEQDAQPLLEERTLDSDRQADLVDENDLLQTKCENKLCAGEVESA